MIKTDLIFILGLSLLVSSCALDAKGDKEMHGVTDINYNLDDTAEVLVTSESGDKIARKKNVAFQQGYAQGNLIVVRPDIVKQTIVGIGTSFTCVYSDSGPRSAVGPPFELGRNVRYTALPTPLSERTIDIEINATNMLIKNRNV